MDRHLSVFADGERFAPDSRYRLTGTVRIGWLGKYTKFTDIENDDNGSV